MPRRVRLYEVRDDVKCLKCGHWGAVKQYGTYYPGGLQSEGDEFEGPLKEYAEQYRNKPYMDCYGTFDSDSWECTNCNNHGHIDGPRVNGEQAFRPKKDEDSA